MIKPKFFLFWRLIDSALLPMGQMGLSVLSGRHMVKFMKCLIQCCGIGKSMFERNLGKICIGIADFQCTMH